MLDLLLPIGIMFLKQTTNTSSCLKTHPSLDELERESPILCVCGRSQEGQQGQSYSNFHHLGCYGLTYEDEGGVSVFYGVPVPCLHGRVSFLVLQLAWAFPLLLRVSPGSAIEPCSYWRPSAFRG